jgi:hypothetical protein
VELINILAAAGLVCGSFVVVAVSIWHVRRISKENSSRTSQKESQRALRKEMQQKATQEFEKAVALNAEFIQKDVRQAAAEVSGHMEKEITHTVEDELDLYKKSSAELTKTIQTVAMKLQTDAQAQQKALFQQISAEQKKLTELLAVHYKESAQRAETQVAAEVARRMKRFEENMATVVRSYITAAVSDQLDVKNDFAYIMQQLEAHKQDMLKDIENGAV